MSPQSCYPDKAPVVDEILDVLSHHIRREVIHYFETYSGTIQASLEKLVHHIDRRVPTTSRQALKIQLVHLHLPKLKDASWIEFDSDLEEVRYEGRSDAKQVLREVYEVF